jgi:hypothetical protein
VVRVYNARGSCLAGAVLTDAVRPGVLRLSCGAWYDPAGSGETAICVHGNANMLTRDHGTSNLARVRPVQLRWSMLNAGTDRCPQFVHLARHPWAGVGGARPAGGTIRGGHDHGITVTTFKAADVLLAEA